MPFDPKTFEKAVARNRRGRGVAVPASLAFAFEKLLTSRQLYLYEQCALGGIRAAGLTVDAVVPSLNLVTAAVDSVYNRLSNVETLAARLKENFVRGDKVHRIAFLDSVNRAIGVNVASVLNDEATGRAVETRLIDSVGLITRFDDEMKRMVTQHIWNGLQLGLDGTSLRQELLERANVPEWRARLIARDQMNKLFGNLNQVRQTDIGVTHFFWRPVHDNAVRDAHEALRDQRFAWASPPSEGIPGEPIQCRCTADPDFSTVKLPDLSK